APLAGGARSRSRSRSTACRRPSPPTPRPSASRAGHRRVARRGARKLIPWRDPDTERPERGTGERMADMDVATTRRGFLARALAGGGLLVSYGLFAAYAVAYLFPPPLRARAQRLFIGRRPDFAAGSARPYTD